MSRTNRIRRAAGLTAVAVTTVTVSVGGIASPAQAQPPSAGCVFVMSMHEMYVQRANAAAHVTAPMMIWSATANAEWHDAVWHSYWDSMRAAGDWADIAIRLGCNRGGPAWRRLPPPRPLTGTS
jgi:hypothetical protein